MAERMSNADNFWLSMDEPTNLMVITGFMEFKKPLDFNRLYATIDSRLASFSRFQRKIVKRTNTSTSDRICNASPFRRRGIKPNCRR